MRAWDARGRRRGPLLLDRSSVNEIDVQSNELRSFRVYRLEIAQNSLKNDAIEC